MSLIIKIKKNNIENWKVIAEYPNYAVSDQGRVKSLNYHNEGREQILKLKKTNDGYLQVQLYKDGKRKYKYLHRLVYETWKGEIPENMQVNHIDEDKSNNRLSNLNLMTPKENTNWATGIERRAKANSKKVLQYTLSGELVNTWKSTHEAGRNGYNYQSVSACCLGKIKTHGGYLWKYVS